jgi:two-component system CheB/CheR fusion protein
MPGRHSHQPKADRPRSASNRVEFPLVAIGASAGGLDACRKLLDALPPTNGMAFIIVQHLDPSHDSMLASPEFFPGNSDYSA